jgi:hypothetical protein
MPTAGDKALDSDMILAAQAVLIEHEWQQETVIATTNLRHLARFFTARDWRDIPKAPMLSAVQCLGKGCMMNADDVFRYGHLTLLGAVETFPIDHWDTPGVCGVWSAKDVVAHLASYELATGDAFAGVLGEESSPTLGLLVSQGEAFNEPQVAQRRGQSPEETLAEYAAAHERAAALLARIPLDRRRQAGIIAWYGPEYDLEDLITYMSYGHKREHSAQIAEFCCRIGDTAG